MGNTVTEGKSMENTIINGVDVSGCEFVGKYKLCKAYCNTGIGKPCGCEYSIDCYFKQSARKDERIKELEQKLSQVATLSAEVIAVGSDNYFEFLIQAVKTTAIIKQIKQIAQGVNNAKM